MKTTPFLLPRAWLWGFCAWVCELLLLTVINTSLSDIYICFVEHLVCVKRCRWWDHLILAITLWDGNDHQFSNPGTTDSKTNRSSNAVLTMLAFPFSSQNHIHREDSGANAFRCDSICMLSDAPPLYILTSFMKRKKEKNIHPPEKQIFNYLSYAFLEFKITMEMVISNYSLCPLI